jgi:hypothetical protein
MAAVVFNYSSWAIRYPELALWVTEPMAQAYFSEACLYCDNTAASPITDETIRATLLNMTVAHIAALNAPLNGQASSTLVGRINNTTEGSITVATENKYPEGTVQWWQATKYGAAFWAATVQYRRMFYIAQPYRYVDPYSPYPPYGHNL